ncbi:uncharacterized protein KY384_004753 [Bacidia gigantensis]|uniref:uncharacterized protein n=1 Tax=Bacidia gigantensis TaxID=2732470 RepID=UPI001D051932|nr:uncharacterized protein KY384_004753 [Bacidia gigantensis]KAG8530252.1 hypothetical protein KY384_004753 [Bacidia gigantensis]
MEGRPTHDSRKDDDGLAYGDDQSASRAPGEDVDEEGEEGDRGLIGDTFRKLRGRHQPQSYEGSSQSNAPSQSQGQGVAGAGSFVFDKLHGVVHGLGTEVKKVVTGQGAIHSHTHHGAQCGDGMHDNTQHRYHSFAPQRTGNDVKWYVDGCGYMWAVSEALERATQSIWILDCTNSTISPVCYMLIITGWLSPELYLRRPPAKNEQYRVDRMLQAAAQRGVKVNIIVYKEVTQALTRKYLTPTVPKYLHSLLPRHTDRFSKAVTSVGLAATFLSLEQVEKEFPLIEAPVTVSSSHTKHCLENLHPNIAVFRHPDHLPDAQTLSSSFISSLQNMSLTAKSAASLPIDALKGIYGMNEDVILYWYVAFATFLQCDKLKISLRAHHEKLCLIDGQIAFMGGLDLCYGRWDTNQHPIADCHPSNLENIVFPGQDFNNARLKGPVVEDLRAHFVERWNFIYDEKYNVRKDVRYSKLTFNQNPAGIVSPPGPQGSYYPSRRELDDDSSRGLSEDHPGFGEEVRSLGENIRGRVGQEGHNVYQQYMGGHQHHSHLHGTPQEAGIPCQIVRSCTKWSHGIPTEHSIANAYIDIIANSQHFIYIENQFFITATSDKQKPVQNKIGRAMVDRILRAARAGEKYKMIILIPAVPAFAGDLKDDASLGTRAIMEFQYFSINRGGYSIMESIANEGFDPTQYIRFYNLRNYDRINVGSTMRDVEQRSGVDYGAAAAAYDQAAELPAQIPSDQYQGRSKYQAYQQASSNLYPQSGPDSGRWDSVSECYMLNGQDIRSVPWTNGNYQEIDAFVSEELYVHSKVLIADDRIVICGSANLNDRSQLGEHDSEIAIIIEDPNSIDSMMNGRPHRAARFAATLRRQLFRKHLGLIPAQDMDRPDQNFSPIGFAPNKYDYGSPEDQWVVDPLSDDFLNFWNSRAKINTDVFGRVFHPVPHDCVRTWQDYDDFYEHFFKGAEKEAEKGAAKKPSKYMWGHVVADEFAPGEEGARQVKEELSKIRGTLVEMPLLFLIKEDIAKEGAALNAFTEEVYT